jgi:hypothetical protein
VAFWIASSQVLVAMTLVGGPPIVLYWLRDTTVARVVRANIIIYFAAASVFTTIGFRRICLIALAALVSLPVFDRALR